MLKQRKTMKEDAKMENITQGRTKMANNKNLLINLLANELFITIENRLGEDCLKNQYRGIEKHTQISNDIKRLRRELLELSKLISPQL